jgi:ribosomal protein S18 acetylase RimI-like enzyme
MRVVVRRVLRGETGPSGGPAMTDLLGVMESWDGQSTTVRTEDGTLTEIAIADIVSGKQVPARASARMRVSAEQACLMSNASWPPVQARHLGDWLLRASGGFSARANSVMAIGDPGVPFDEALAETSRFYREHGLDPWAQVVVGSETGDRFQAAGWTLARPGEADSEFHIASVAQAARAVRTMLPGSPPPVTVVPRLTPAWLANDERALAHRDAAVAVLEGPAQVGFAEIRAEAAGPEEPLLAKGRIACDGEWAGITDVWVAPEFRRRGLGVVVLDAMVSWAAERGATSAYLQVRADNTPALALYATMGFRAHHSYRYLAARQPDDGG